MRLLYLFLFFFTSYVMAEYSFSGNNDFSEKVLSNIIAEDWQLYQNNQDDISYIDDASYKILQHYRTNGYHFTVVDYDIENNKVLFSIKEYKSIEIKKVAIFNQEKNKALFFSEERLSKFITPPPKIGKYIFNKSKTESDASAIASFYVSKGFLHTQAKTEYIFSPEAPLAQSVGINIHIEEGPRAYLKNVIFSGNKSIPDDVLNFVKSDEKIFTPGSHQKMAEALRIFYREQGYAQVKVKAELIVENNEPEKENITIKLTIKEGMLNYIRNIQIKGNSINDTVLVEQQLDVHEGQLFSLENIVSTEQNIQRTDLFLFVEIEEDYVSEDKLDLLIHVKERERQSYSFLLGYNTTYGLVGGAKYENISFLGSGWRFVVDLESTIVGGDLAKSQFKVNFTDPWAFGKRDLAFTIGTFASLEETQTFTAFDRGADMFFTKYFIQDVSESGLVNFILTGEFGYRLNFSEIIDVEDDDLDNEEGLTVFSTLHQKLTLDLRDNRIYPLSGSYNFIELEQSFTVLGSDVDYFKFYVHSAWYYNLFWDWVLAIAVRGGVVVPFNDSNVPIQKRFFAGGATTVRSFEQNDLPPLDGDDNPVGGEGLFLASCELRIPVYAGLGVSMFVDSGEVIAKVRTFNDYRIDNLKYGVGFGIWYNIPHLGALRFDYAYNPDREENPLTGNKEDASNIFISIGFAF